MRIALVIERFDPRSGGAEAAAWNTAHALADSGDEVVAITRRSAPGPRVAVRSVRAARFWQPWRVLAFSRAARRASSRQAFDAVLSFSRTRHQDVYRAGGGSHADYLDQRGAGSLRRLSPRHRVLLSIERRVFADPAQWIWCSSQRVRDSIAQRHGVPPERFFVLPNGVDLERFDPAQRQRWRRPLRAAFGAGRAPVWLLLGSGWERKGLDTALRALARSAARDARLWVAGRDRIEPWQRRAQALGLAERVRFLGPRSDPEALLAAADALLLPTRYDAFANACLEAAASGIPVVTSAANGAAEVLGAGGLVVADAADVDGFAQALDRLADPERRQSHGAAARQAVLGLGWPSHAKSLRDLLAHVSERRARALRAPGRP